MPKIIQEPDQHRCHDALTSVDHLPAGTVVECDCGRRYIRCEDQRDGLYWKLTDSGLRHGYTSHLHPCCRQARVERPPGSIVRCGGPAMCRKCQADAAAIHVGATPEQLLIDITRKRDAARAEATRVADERDRAHELLDRAERIMLCVGGAEPTDQDVAEWVVSRHALAGRAVPGVDVRVEHRVRTAAAEEPLAEWERELLAEQVPGAGDAGKKPVRRFDDGEPQRRCSFICHEHGLQCEASEPRPWHHHDRHYHVGPRCAGGWDSPEPARRSNAYCWWDRGSHQPHRFGDPVHWCNGAEPDESLAEMVSRKLSTPEHPIAVRVEHQCQTCGADHWQHDEAPNHALGAGGRDD